MSEDPIRLADDPNEPAALRDDLASASGASAFGYDVDRGLAQLRATLGGGGAGGGGSTALAGGWKGIAVALVSIAGVGAVVWWLAQDRQPTAAREEAEPAPIAEGEAPAPIVSGSEAPAPAEPEEPAASDEAHGEGPSVAQPVRPERIYPDEITYVARARAALGDHPSRALSLAVEGQRHYRDGVLGEELEAIRILALARLGRIGEARRRAARFLDASPHHPMAAQVRRAVEGPP
jgi:hypothetical protein